MMFIGNYWKASKGFNMLIDNHRKQVNTIGSNNIIVQISKHMQNNV